MEKAVFHPSAMVDELLDVIGWVPKCEGVQPSTGSAGRCHLNSKHYCRINDNFADPTTASWAPNLPVSQWWPVRSVFTEVDNASYGPHSGLYG